MPPVDRSSLAFVATDDAPELGVRAGDRFYWQYTDEGPQMRQVRDWKNPISLLALFDAGGLQALERVAPAHSLRQAVGSPPDPPVSSRPKLVE